ncbi:hypothetical protein HEMA109418_08585 [Helcobacillus massiliensis]
MHTMGMASVVIFLLFAVAVSAVLLIVVAALALAESRRSRVTDSPTAVRVPAHTPAPAEPAAPGVRHRSAPTGPAPRRIVPDEEATVLRRATGIHRSPRRPRRDSIAA